MDNIKNLLKPQSFPSKLLLVYGNSSFMSLSDIHECSNGHLMAVVHLDNGYLAHA